MIGARSFVENTMWTSRQAYAVGMRHCGTHSGVPEYGLRLFLGSSTLGYALGPLARFPARTARALKPTGCRLERSRNAPGAQPQRLGLL
jgi:hypothetical protein